MPAARALTIPERTRLAAEILAAYLQVRRLLGRAPISATVSTLRAEDAAKTWSCAAIGSRVDALPEARRIGRAVARTLAILPGDTRCLVQSLVLSRLLARRGIPARLVIGARPEPDFLAHAWVECAGQPVLEPGDGSFGRLVEL